MKFPIALFLFFLLHTARAQLGIQPMLLLAPEGTRLASFGSESNTFSDSMMTGLQHISALRFNDYDTLFYIVDRGDSVGRHCRILSFPASVIFKKPISNVDTFFFADHSDPTDIAFLSDSQAFVTLAGTGALEKINLITKNIDTTFLLPGRPRAMMRTSLSRLIIICAGATDNDSSHIVELNTDVNLITATLAIAGAAQSCVLDRNFNIHVLSKLQDTAANIVVVTPSTTIDTIYHLAGEFNLISITSGIDTSLERVLLSNGSGDSLLGQYNPLKRVIFQRGPRCVMGVGFGSGIVAVERSAVTQYFIEDSGVYNSESRVLTPTVAQYTASLQVNSFSVNAVHENIFSPPTTFLQCTIAPQPCSTTAFVDVSDESHETNGTHTSFALYDFLGREHRVTTPIASGQWKIDATTLSAGIYFGVARDGSNAIVKPISVVK